jgi:hypothetical protein
MRSSPYTLEGRERGTVVDRRDPALLMAFLISAAPWTLMLFLRRVLAMIHPEAASARVDPREAKQRVLTRGRPTGASA